MSAKSYELDEVHQALTNKKNEAREQEQQLESIKDDADEAIQKEKLVETLIDYFKDTNFGEREQAYFDKMLEHFLRSIGEWVQQKVAGMSR